MEVVPTLLGALVFLGLMAGLYVPLESWAPIGGGRDAWTRARVRTLGTGAALLVANTFVMQLVGAPLLERLERFHLPGEASLARQLAVLVLADVAGYWAHRAMHRVPALWRLHRLHHAPTEIGWIDAWRQHPIDFLIHGVAVGVPGALLHASLSDLASVVLLRKAFTTFLHADVRIRLGVVETLIASPAFHRVHHSADPADLDRNFAGTFPFVDRLFGTYRRATGFPARLGLQSVAASSTISQWGSGSIVGAGSGRESGGKVSMRGRADSEARGVGAVCMMPPSTALGEPIDRSSKISYLPADCNRRDAPAA